MPTGYQHFALCDHRLFLGESEVFRHGPELDYEEVPRGRQRNTFGGLTRVPADWQEAPAAEPCVSTHSLYQL